MPNWLLIRLITIPLGIISALALARDGFGLKILPLLDAIIRAYGLLIDDLFLDFVLAIVGPVFSFFKAFFGWNWSLYPHWKYAVVLLWLFNGSYERANLMPAEYYAAGIKSAHFRHSAYNWAWASFAALAGGVLAGIVPVTSASVLWWPITAFFLYLCGRYTIKFAFSYINLSFRITEIIVTLIPAFAFSLIACGIVQQNFIANAIWLPLTALFFSEAVVFRRWWRGVLSPPLAAITSSFALGIFPTPEWLAFDSARSVGLAQLTVFVAILGTWYVIVGLIDYWHLLNVERLTSNAHPEFAIVRAGMDIMAVIGGAAAIIYVSHILA